MVHWGVSQSPQDRARRGTTATGECGAAVCGDRHHACGGLALTGTTWTPAEASWRACRTVRLASSRTGSVARAIWSPALHRTRS